MEKKKRMGIGWRGWMLVIYQFTAMLAYVVFNNYPMNFLAGELGLYGGAPTVPTISSIGIIVGIICQIILASKIGKIKSVKGLSIGLGIATMILSLGVMVIPPEMQTFWQIVYFLCSVVILVWATFTVGILVGQWFPRRKGTIMGIVTFAFPIGNALLTPFIGMVTAPLASGGAPNIFGAYLPFFIVICIGLVIGAVFLKDYPEQVGCYRDNDPSLSPEIAKKMMEEEIENKRTTVWTLGHTLKSPDFWLITVPMGLMLLGSVGVMTQTAPILNVAYQSGDLFGPIMLGNAVCACIGSYVLGLLDTKLGTRTSMIIAFFFMALSGILGMIQSFGTMVAAMMLLAIFMGASSNFTVSGSVQYWRREDFPTVFGVVNPVANLIQAVAPVLFSALIFSVGGVATTAGVSRMFIFILCSAVVSLIMMFLFRPGRIKAYDDKYRQAAGKPLDDALVGRK